MEKHSDFGVGLDLTPNIYTMSHTFMTASHHRAIVEILTDDILLEVFDWYRQTLLEQWTNTWKWVTLVHVCRRWRHIVFGVAMPSGFVAPMYIWNTREEGTGLLAILAYFH
jgi:hypothetical protein